MNFFLIESPLQYLNALEAKYYFNIPSDEAKLIVFRGVSEDNIQQIKESVSESEWQDIEYILSSERKIRKYALKNHFRNILKETSIKKVFIGDYRSYLMRHFANISDSEDVIMLDDGRSSVDIHKMIFERVDIRNRNSNLRRILNNLAGLKDQSIKDISLFTVYDSDHNNNNKLHRNNYDYLRKSLKEKPVSDTVLFIGNCFTELNLMSEEDYLKSMRKISEFYEGKRIMYVPHRREKTEKLNNLTGLNALDLQRYNIPLELALSKSDAIPGYIASFYTSAIDNIEKIIGSDVELTAFRPNLDLFDQKIRGTAEEAYNYYSMNHNIRVINI
ncbi:polysialyltransferase family glycosyltransferase [Balneola sp. MJW-20]|uniref:polysialyltransferase family glycosyltransferase n=1 Tax=Gracilimonas aurantiaca TaxID=3234185 RepID=UPI003465BDE6